MEAYRSTWTEPQRQLRAGLAQGREAGVQGGLVRARQVGEAGPDMTDFKTQ